MKLVFATTNKHKLEELKSLVQGLSIEVLSLEEVEPVEVEEDASTLEGNATKKARAYVEKTGLAALADDTGLCVDALGGAPGVHSARYGGYEGAEKALGDACERYRLNNERLVRELSGAPAERRGAEFRTALCLIVPGREEVIVQGIVRGRILEAPRGGHGFGYDPYFEIPELGKTLAELTTEEKNRISHRARAFQALRPHLERLAKSEG
ncbi:MAG TPA: non-canonical purine NTP pyrophosphatase, RdgB/HAM1 family [Myxococcales bacterium]|jgi:XTP/dITP diphosphohydrolase|nr:non-canonical purine NTP pyrophosphatase, RdgB/HAM1 family [Myxococcales bacterium]